MLAQSSGKTDGHMKFVYKLKAAIFEFPARPLDEDPGLFAEDEMMLAPPSSSEVWSPAEPALAASSVSLLMNSGLVEILSFIRAIRLFKLMQDAI